MSSQSFLLDQDTFSLGDGREMRFLSWVSLKMKDPQSHREVGLLNECLHLHLWLYNMCVYKYIGGTY